MVYSTSNEVTYVYNFKINIKYQAAIASVIYSFYSCRVCNTPVQELPEHVFEVDAESDSKTVSHLLFLLYLILLDYILYHNLRPKKLIICFSGTARVTFNPQHKKYQLAAIFVYVMVGWLNSGAPTLDIRHH